MEQNTDSKHTRRQFLKKTSAATLFVGVGPAFLLTSCHSGTYTATGAPPTGFVIVDMWIDNITGTPPLRTGTFHIKYKNDTGETVYLNVGEETTGLVDTGGATRERTVSWNIPGKGSEMNWDLADENYEGTITVP